MDKGELSPVDNGRAVAELGGYRIIQGWTMLIG
jgi:hypothetical protein